MRHPDRRSRYFLGRLLAKVRWLVAIFYRQASFRSACSAVSAQTTVLCVVEGQNDVEFLRRISAVLHREDASVPDLAEMERHSALIFVPAGGGDAWSAFRFHALKLPEFHLMDRDVPPATETRQRVTAMVNSRPNCRAATMSKRSLENFLHADAVFEASGILVAISDEDNVPELIARSMRDCHPHSVPWDQLPARARKRLRDKAKKWLNSLAVEHMTPERLAERDPSGEVRSWLMVIAELAGASDAMACR